MKVGGYLAPREEVPLWLVGGGRYAVAEGLSGLLVSGLGPFDGRELIVGRVALHHWCVGPSRSGSNGLGSVSGVVDSVWHGSKGSEGLLVRG